MPAAAEREQEFGGFSGVARFAEDAAAERHGGIGAEHDVIGPGRDGGGLFARHAGAIGPGQFAPRRVFVDVRGQDGIGHKPELRQKLPPAWAGGA